MDVREALKTGQVLIAANSAYASQTFSAGARAVLLLLLADVAEALASDLADVLSGERVMKGKAVDGNMHGHLPFHYVRAGWVGAQETRELAQAALGDQVLLATWVLA